MKTTSTILSILIVLMLNVIYTSCTKKSDIKQYGDISGKVKHAITGEPISGAGVALSPSSTTTTTGSEGTYTFAELEPKEYSIQVMKDGFQTNTTSVQVIAGENRVGDILMTPAQPVLRTSTTLLDFGSEKILLPFEIHNDGASQLNWTITLDKPWLSASINSGSTSANVSTVNISVDRSQLGKSTYTGAVVVNSNGGSVTINVTVNVTGPLLSITPITLDFGTTDTDKSVQISNIGVGSLSYNAITSDTWITLQGPSGTVTTDIKIMHILVNRAGLSPGNYAGYVIVNSNANSISIPVVMQIQAPSSPTVIFGTILNLNNTSAQITGNIISLGSTSVSQHGHCWSTTPMPTISNSKTQLGSATVIGIFTSSLASLQPTTTYYVRAYATNGVGTSYSDQLDFTTDSGLKPTVSSAAISNITSTTASAGGNVTNQGDTPVTMRGVCWSTSLNPTTADSHTSNGSGMGVFSSDLTGLSPTTTYYVRAYATNSIGTSYGNQLSFTTIVNIGPPTVTTSTVTTITGSTAVSGGNVTTDGGSSISARGVCWSTNSNPTISDNHTSNGSGTGIFSSNITGLSPSTFYYLRAYATNSIGTSYGNQLTFTTINNSNPPSVTTSSVTNITPSTATCGGNVTSDGGSTVIERGVCWSTNSNPTLSDSHTSNGSGTGVFTSSITGLSESTTYYVRAYATNNVATAFGSPLSFTTTSSNTVTDIDGNVYSKVVIGTQTWLGENLKVTHYNDGTQIPNITDNSQWFGLAIGAYCWYANDEATYKNTYGAIYNWYTVVDSRDLCPVGWHVPSDSEWNELSDYLGGYYNNDGGKLKEIGYNHWQSPNTGATDETGFTGLPGGFREGGGLFYDNGNSGIFWSSTSIGSTYAKRMRLTYYYDYIDIYNESKKFGYSVRCIKD